MNQWGARKWTGNCPRAWTVFAVAVLLSTMTVAGCVSPAVLQETIAKLERSHIRTVQVAKEFEAFKEQATEEIYALKQEQTRLAKELVTAQTAVGDTQTNLESSKYHLDNERQIRHQTESKLGQLEAARRSLAIRIAELEKRLENTQDKLGRAWEARGRALARAEYLEEEQSKLTKQLVTAQGKERQLAHLTKEVGRERDLLLMKVEELQKSLSRVQVRLVQLEREKKRTRGALAKAKNRAKMLESALSAEQENWKSLQKALTKVRQNAEPAVQ